MLTKIIFVNLICEVCKNPFKKEIRKINAAINKGYRFNCCSKQCSIRLRSAPIIKVSCTGCGDILLRKSYLVKRKTNFWCSRECSKINGKVNYKDKALEFLEHVCVSCGENRKYLLVVHHIDGNNKNNHISNLEFVCPTCHSLRHLHLKENDQITMNTKFLTPREQLKKLTTSNVSFEFPEDDLLFS